jgi:tetraacyldisaccharide 4'-kinase
VNPKFKVYKILLPLAWLYGLGVCFRNKLFDWKILPTETFDVPVISVGNLAVGGTGKTPHTEYLIALLSKKYKLAVLSRGYKRKSKGFILADENASAQKIGDEPYQMYRKFPNVLVAVDVDRRRGIRNLLNLPEEEKPEIILLDDAFQHRYVKPSLSILLTDSNRLFYNDYLLPAGKLREPAKNHSRANMIIYTKYQNACYGELDSPSPKQVFFTSYAYKGLLPVFPSINPVKKESIERLKKESYSFLLIAGLANPSGLLDYLRKYTSDLHPLIYPDHHHFTDKNRYEIKKAFEGIKNENKLIITSEKDAMRLMNNPNFPEELKAFIFYLPIEVVFNLEQESLFIQNIEEHVKNFARNRSLA